jgi:hypothetical protein
MFGITTAFDRFVIIPIETFSPVIFKERFTQARRGTGGPLCPSYVTYKVDTYSHLPKSENLGGVGSSHKPDLMIEIGRDLYRSHPE